MNVGHFILERAFQMRKPEKKKWNKVGEVGERAFDTLEKKI